MAGPAVEGGLSEEAPAHTPTLDDIVGLWRVRRLSWRGLPQSVLVPAVAIGALVVLTSLVLVTAAFGWPLPGGTLTVPSFVGRAPETVDAAVIALIWLALAVLSAAALSLTGREDARHGRVTRIAVALVMFTFLADLVNVGDTLHGYDSAGLAQGSLAIWRIYQGAGWIGIVASLAILFVPRRSLGSPVLPVLLGAAPYLLGLLAFFAASAVTYRLPGSTSLLSTQALAARPFVDNGEILTYGIVLIVFWKAATWARAGATVIGLRVTALAERWRWVFWILLAAKAAFLAIGYLTAGPCTGSGPFVASRCDEPVAWLIAAGFALAATVWLVRAERWPIGDSRLTQVAAAVVIGFAALSLALVLSRPVTALVALVEIGGRVDVGTFPTCLTAATGLTPLVACSLQGLDGLVVVAPLATALLALVIGVLLLARRSAAALPVGLPLVVFGLWAAPRALDAFQILILGIPAAQVPALGFELATFDAVLTVFIGLAALVLWQRVIRGRLAARLTLALVVSLLMAHGSTFIPADLAPTLFVLMLPVPILYVLLVDSGGLNASGSGRPTAVLRFMVISGSLLLLACAAISLHTTDPGDTLYEDFASLLFLAPFAMITVAALITNLNRPREATA